MRLPDAENVATGSSGVGVMERDGGEGFGSGVAFPESYVCGGNASEGLVEFDAFDSEEGKARGEEHGAAFAGSNIEEDGALDGLRCGALEPVVKQAFENAGRDAVVGSKFVELGPGALDDDFAGDEAGGIRAVFAVEGVDGGLDLFTRRHLAKTTGWKRVQGGA